MLVLRRGRLLTWGLQAVTIPTTVAGFAGGISYFGNIEMDPTKPIFVCFPSLFPQAMPHRPILYRISIPCSSWELPHLAVQARFAVHPSPPATL